jgi:hypothetical protein
MTRAHMVDTDPKLPHRAAGAGEMLLSRNRRGYWHRVSRANVHRRWNVPRQQAAVAGAVGFRGRLMEMRPSEMRPSRVRRWLGRVAGCTAPW